MIFVFYIFKLIYNDDIEITPTLIAQGSQVHLSQYSKGYMLIFLSDSKINKYVYDSNGLLQNMTECGKTYNYHSFFSSINKGNKFVISNKQPIVFSDEDNNCQELNGNVAGYGLRLAYFPNGYFTIVTRDGVKAKFSHYSETYTKLEYEHEFDENNLKLDNEILEVIGTNDNILLLFHTPNFSGENLHVRLINTYQWTIVNTIRVNVSKPTNINLLFLNWEPNDYYLIMYCYTTQTDNNLFCSCGYLKKNDQNQLIFEPQNNFEILQNCENGKNNGFISSSIIDNDYHKIAIVCKGNNPIYFHFTIMTYHQVQYNDIAANTFIVGIKYSLKFTKEVKFPNFAPFTNNYALFYEYDGKACVTYFFLYSCKNGNLTNAEVGTTITISFSDYFEKGVLETRDMKFKITSIPNEITIKKDSNSISASDETEYSPTQTFELTGNNHGTYEIEFCVKEKENIKCKLSIKIIQGCDEGCVCDTNNICIECTHDDTNEENNYYKKKDENPIVCYKASTGLNGYYINKTNKQFERCFDSCERCSGLGTFSNNLCESGKCEQYYFAVDGDDKVNECWNNTIRDNVAGNYFFYSNKYYKCDENCLKCSILKSNCTECNTINNYYPVDGESNTCYEYNKEGYYFDNNQLYKCDQSCKTCENSATNCIECNTINNYYPVNGESNTCYEYNKEGYYFDNNQLYKCDQSCKTCENSATNCIECNTSYYPIINTNSPCYNSAPQKYYLDNNFYKPCYSSCKTCSNSGTSEDNNCDSCEEGYSSQISKTTNCVLDCNKYFYIDSLESNKYTCHNEDECPNLYPLLAGIQCVKSCQDDNDCNLCKEKILYEYNGECIENCPNEYQVSSNGKKCEKIMVLDDNKCNFERSTIEVSVNNLDNNIDGFAQNYATENYLIKNSVSIINHIDSLYSIQIFKNEICLNEESSISKIDLGNCPTILKGKLNLEEIIILKADVQKTQNNQQKTVITYAFYSPLGERLNVSLCSEEKITVTIPLTEENGGDIELAKEMAQQGIDIYNIDDPFFNDICYPFTSKEGEDVSLNDRVQNYYQNVSLCENDCEYKGVNFDNGNGEVECECTVKSTFLDNFDNEITGEIFELVSSAQFKIFQCYKNVFNKNYCKSNLGLWIFFVFGVFKLILISLYMKIGLTKINSYLMRRIKTNCPPDEEGDNNKNNKINNEEHKEANPPKKSEQYSPEQDFVIYDLGRNSRKNNNDINYEISQNYMNNSYSNYSPKQNMDLTKYDNLKTININQKKNSYYNDNIPIGTSDSLREITNKKNIQKINQNIDIDVNMSDPKNFKNQNQTISNTNEISVFRGNPEILPKLQRQNTIILEENVTKKIKKKYTKRFLVEKVNDDNMFDEDELNGMSVEDAREYDKRTFCEFFWEQLIKKQDILNLIFDDDPYQNVHIRWIIFIFEIELYFFISALFYIESLIAKNIHKPKSNSLIEILVNEIERLIYSEIISIVVDMLTKCLTEPIKRLKLLNDTEKYQERYIEQVSKITKDMKIMHITFIIVDVVFYFIFWYYVSAFSAVKINSRRNWLEGCLITFSIIQFFSFFICFLSASFRYIGLRCSCLGFLYGIGQFLI